MLFLKEGMGRAQVDKMLRTDRLPVQAGTDEFAPECQVYSVDGRYVLTVFFDTQPDLKKPLALRRAELARQGRIITSLGSPKPPTPSKRTLDPALVGEAMRAMRQQESNAKERSDK